jgi:hypothetical protein
MRSKAKVGLAPSKAAFLTMVVQTLQIKHSRAIILVSALKKMLTVIFCALS